MIPKADGAKLDVTKPGLFLCRITRDLASAWMERNTANRPVRRSHVRMLAGMILKNEWRADHTACIVFDRTGKLSDGQHRLLAVIEAGLPVLMRVETGADPELREYIDTGKARQLYDRKTFVGDETHNRIIAAILRAEHYKTVGNWMPITPKEGEEMYATMPASYAWAASLSQRGKVGMTRTGTLLAMAHGHHRAPDLCSRFWTSYIVPDGQIQAARMLRDWMLRSPMGTQQMVDDYERAVSCLVAAFDGRDVSLVRRTAEFPEHFREK